MGCGGGRVWFVAQATNTLMLERDQRLAELRNESLRGQQHVIEELRDSFELETGVDGWAFGGL